MEIDQEKGPQRAYKYRYEGAKFPDNCAYCEYSKGEIKPLNRRGHVISGFVFKAIRDARKARNREINKFHVYDADGYRMPAQDGMKFKHLCNDCENRFSEWETHFRKFLNNSYSENKTTNLDFIALSFALSIAWRIIYSNSIRSGDGAEYFRRRFSGWLEHIPRKIDNIDEPGGYDTYFFSGESVVQTESAVQADDEMLWRLENDYLFSVIQHFSEPQLVVGIKGSQRGFRCGGSPVLYVQLGSYHLLFAPAGYFKESIVRLEKILENLYSISDVRDMKALGAIYGRIGSDNWCRDAYLERHIYPASGPKNLPLKST
ncbi:hypothetical protein MRS60_29975 [Burkholderia pyrrocinia]|uniref:hypothetical protein n=1 Tax=Burkholderia pyrrocinia TaxID=60550 RepID=UPI001FB1C242|nr:hypothetical protein [Burkholderia pyrrocinia]UOB58399.1 hypothetical protein MRS60_29975 [Burkholderia pyrrocinia]